MHIDICVATFQRPKLLEKLLSSLLGQEIHSGVIYRIIIIDNDADASAKGVVENLADLAAVDLIYDVEPEQNISLARNRALSHTLNTADYIIFVDDDEYASVDWLQNHIDTAVDLCADVVFGPVIPVYPENAPDWVVQGKFFERERVPTGSIRRHGGTGNTLVKRKVFNELPSKFDPAYGLTGGGDTELFWRLGKTGATMVWCDTAIVYEHVPFARMNVKWLLRRAFRGGQNYPRVFIRSLSINKKLIWGGKRLIFAVVSIMYLPLAMFQGKAVRVRALQRVYSCVGQLIGLTRYQYLEYKESV